MYSVIVIKLLKKKEKETLRQKIEGTQAQLDSLQAEHGTQLENEAQIRRLDILKKIIEPILKP